MPGMKAMLLDGAMEMNVGVQPLRLAEVDVPEPVRGQVRIRVSVCGVCHTELDEIEGRLPPPAYPAILGHQVVGRVEALGEGGGSSLLGQRVGVAWIASACGECEACRSGQENLCAHFRATGRDVGGGYAQFVVARQDFIYAIPAELSDAQAAPLLCAGAIGYRSLRLANLHDGQALGLAGFGASAHLVLKLARHLYPNSPVSVFSRSPEECDFAMQLGATWAGGFDQAPEQPLQAIIDTTPAWTPILASLGNLAPGGRLVINAIRKERRDQAALQDLDYSRHLWLEKEIKSVANVTRQDVSEFLQLAAELQIRPEVQLYGLEEANRALWELKNRRIRGAKVLQMV